MNRTLPFIVVSVLAGCSSSSPADVAGDYTVNITDKANGCMLGNWTEGDTTNNIGVSITQTGAHATVTVNGLAGAYVNAVIGGSTWDGSVDGNQIDAILHGTVSKSMGNCSYFITAEIAASLTKDTLDGE